MAPLRRTFFGILVVAVLLTVVFWNSCFGTVYDRWGNEPAAARSLLYLANCEVQIRESGKVDVDRDGIGEYAFFQEMTGSAGVRIDPRGIGRGVRIDPSILSPAFDRMDAGGCVDKEGYLLRVYLPGADTPAVSEGVAGAPYSGPVATDAAEKHWCAYAWPASPGKGGRRAYYVSEKGDIWQSAIESRRYSIVGTPPPWNAALPPGASWGASPRSGVPATDGETWTLAR